MVSEPQIIKGGSQLKNKIAELRKKKKETQEELAFAVGVTRQTIISLENGKYTASLPLAFKIARHFDTTIESIFMEEESCY
jgi:putative transcriptional regulator